MISGNFPRAPGRQHVAVREVWWRCLRHWQTNRQTLGHGQTESWAQRGRLGHQVKYFWRIFKIRRAPFCSILWYSRKNMTCYWLSLEKGSDQLIATLYTISIYSSVHKQLIRTKRVVIEELFRDRLLVSGTKKRTPKMKEWETSEHKLTGTNILKKRQNGFEKKMYITPPKTINKSKYTRF